MKVKILKIPFNEYSVAARKSHPDNVKASTINLSLILVDKFKIRSTVKRNTLR